MTTGRKLESPVRSSGLGSLFEGRGSLMKGWMRKPVSVDIWALLFVAARAGHELADGLFGAFAVVEDGVHLLGDGHLYGVAGCETECGSGTAYAFGDFPVETLHNFG